MIRRAAANVSNKQPTVVGPPAWGLDVELSTASHKNDACHEILQRASALDGLFE